MTTLTLTWAPLPHPKSLAQQIFEPAQVNHEAVIFICETCERRGFLPPAYGTTGSQWLCPWGAGGERRCCGGPVPTSVLRRASPRVPRRRRPCTQRAGALPRSGRHRGGGGESRGRRSHCRRPAWPRETADMHNLQSKLPLTCTPFATALLLCLCARFPSVVCLCGCVSETKCCLGRADKRLAETLPPFLEGHSVRKRWALGWKRGRR